MNKRTVTRHKKFKNDFKKVRLTDEQFQKFIRYIHLLSEGQSLPPEAKEHSLNGVLSHCREFYLGGDQLVIYQENGTEIILTGLGSHSQLFR